MTTTPISDDEFERGLAATLATVDGSIDTLLIPCPKCGGQLRGEIRKENRSVAEACELYGVTEADLREAGAQISAFGTVKCAVPYVTCMHCGFDADASPAGPAPKDDETKGWT